MSDGVDSILAQLVGHPLPLPVAMALEAGGADAALRVAWDACREPYVMTDVLRAHGLRTAARAARRARDAAWQRMVDRPPGVDAGYGYAEALRRLAVAIRGAVPCPTLATLLAGGTP